jgi:hypothetical protein
VLEQPDAGTSYSFPAPATGSSMGIACTLEAAGKVEIAVFNEAGDLASTLSDERGAGTQVLNATIKDFAPGVYFYVLSIKYVSGKIERQAPHKFVVIK